MSIWEAILSGIVQGLTEFLPVSSSGHLVFAHSLFGVGEPKVLFDVCLHFATLASVVIFFRRDIAELFKSQGRMWRVCIAAGTVPAVLAGLLFEKYVSSVFGSPRVVSVMLLITAAVLIPAQVALSAKNRKVLELGPGKAFWVGMAQAAAIIPGLSRSALTISAGLSSGMRGEESFRFSFLLSVPIIAGATLYKVLSEMVSGGNAPAVSVPVLVAGMGFAFLSGMAGLFFLKRAVMFKKIWVFSVYCFIVGSAGLVLWR